MVTINIEAGKPTPPLLYISIIGAHGHSIFKLELKINKENNYSAQLFTPNPRMWHCVGFFGHMEKQETK